MPSNAYTNYLEVLLNDPEEVMTAHKNLRSGKPGRQWGLGSLNRAALVLCVSAWEAYVEEVIKEALDTLKPPAPHLGSWEPLKAYVLSDIKRFHTPNAKNVKDLVGDAIGLPDITASWAWKNCTPAQARKRLNEMLEYRHKIAHGVNPRPTVHNKWGSSLPPLVRSLGRQTDKAIAAHLATLGVTVVW